MADDEKSGINKSDLRAAFFFFRQVSGIIEWHKAIVRVGFRIAEVASPPRRKRPRIGDKRR